jgi:hypothetical protein
MVEVKQIIEKCKKYCTNFAINILINFKNVKHEKYFKFYESLFVEQDAPI